MIHSQFNGRVSIALKSLFLAWLLLPVHINGSSVMFDLVLSPLHRTATVTGTQLASDIKDLARAGLVSLLDDILQPAVTSTLSTAEAGLKLAQLTVLQCREVITPPLSCAGTLVLNSPSLLITAATDMGNNVLDLINILSLYSYDVVNSILSYSNTFVHLLSSLLYSIFEEFIVLFEDPINVTKRYSLAAISSCQYLATKITEYYQYNEKNPLLFSEIFKGIKKIVTSEVLRILKNIYIVFDRFTQVLRLKVLPVATQFNSNCKYFSEVSFNIVYQCFSKMQPALKELIDYVKVIFDLIEQSLNSVIFSVQHCFRVCSNYLIRFLSEIVRVCLGVYEGLIELSIYLFKSISNHIYQNQKQPRLFSQLFKQMITQVK